MATTSTIPAFYDRFVTVATSALATSSRSGGQVQVAYAWPGASTRDESVFLGRHPETADIRLDATSDIPTLKAGRKQRQENYDVEFTVWVFRPDLHPDDAKICHVRAFEILDDLEDELADDPQLGLPSIQLAKMTDLVQILWPFETGWSCELVATLEVRARLT